MKKIYFTATILLLASCSMEQKPAPYEVYGGRYYGKSTSQYVAKHPAYHSEDTLDPSNPDYNKQIDQRNANHIAARPIGGDSSRLQNSATTSSNGISARPLGEAPAIDGNEQVVKLDSGKTVIHSGTSSATSSTTAYDFQKNREYKAREETVPPVENTDNFVNPSEKNQERNADEKLSHLKPMPKPAYTPSKAEAAAANKTKVTAKVSSTTKSTIGVVNKPDENADDSDVVDNSDEQVDATPASEPIKKIPVEASRVVDNEAAKNKRETAIAAQKAIKQQPIEAAEETVPVVEKPEVEKPVEAPVQAENSTPAKSKSQFIKPVDGAVVAEFGGDNAAGGFNDGINIQAPEGTPVKSSAGGTVVYSGNQLQGYGNMVIVKHSNGFLTAYSHLKGLEVKKGDQVNQGEVIGHVGKTGNISSPQLHFGIRKGREPVDPKDYL